jgi:hypothetical protein
VQVPPIRNAGSFNLFEVFGEVRVPILADKPFFKMLALEGAARYADYNTIGGVFTWRGAVDWEVNDWLRLRGNYSRAIRAPNLAELFAPTGQGFIGGRDPCLAVNRPSAAQKTLCVAQGVPAAFIDTLTVGASQGFGTERCQTKIAYTNKKNMKKSRLVIIIYLLCIAFENSYADTFPDAIHARLKNNIVEDFSSLMQGTILDEMILSVKQKHPEKSYARGLYAQKLSRWYKIQLKPGKDLIDAQKLLLKTGYFDVVEAIPLVKTCFNPNDPSTAQQYHLGLMKMFEGWDIFQGDTNTVIGITDTGFEFTHEDLAGSVKINYNDMPDGIDNDNDDNDK